MIAVFVLFSADKAPETEYGVYYTPHIYAVPQLNAIVPLSNVSDPLLLLVLSEAITTNSFAMPVTLLVVAVYLAY